MAKVDVFKIVLDSEREFRDVLQETLKEAVPEAKVDRDKLFRIFKARVERYFRRPVEVRDSYVQVESKN